MHILRRSARFSLVVLGAVALVAGCGYPPPPPNPASPTPAAGGRQYEGSGPFSDRAGAAMITYNPARVPVGSTATVTVTEQDASTLTMLKVSGLNPNSRYGAHAHVNPCGATGEAAGPHFQFRQDPVTPSVDPAYANPTNEIWLDVATDAQGAGSSTSTVPWKFPADRRARSVVIHDMATMTEPGKAGTAGSRPACIDTEF